MDWIFVWYPIQIDALESILSRSMNWYNLISCYLNPNSQSTTWFTEMCRCSRAEDK
jgi:hypothetical protein